jgi:hypothetical protein
VGAENIHTCNTDIDRNIWPLLKQCRGFAGILAVICTCCLSYLANDQMPSSVFCWSLGSPIARGWIQLILLVILGAHAWAPSGPTDGGVTNFDRDMWTLLTT